MASLASGDVIGNLRPYTSLLSNHNRLSTIVVEGLGGSVRHIGLSDSLFLSQYTHTHICTYTYILYIYIYIYIYSQT